MTEGDGRPQGGRPGARPDGPRSGDRPDRGAGRPDRGAGRPDRGRPASDARPDHARGEGRPQRAHGEGRPPRAEGDTRPPRTQGDGRAQSDGRSQGARGFGRPPRSQGDGPARSGQGDARPPRSQGEGRPARAQGDGRPDRGRPAGGGRPDGARGTDRPRYAPAEGRSDRGRPDGARGGDRPARSQDSGRPDRARTEGRPDRGRSGVERPRNDAGHEGEKRAWGAYQKATPDPARRAAFDALVAVASRDAYANLTLPSLLAERRLTGRDAAFVTELTYGTLRHRGTLDAILAAGSSRPIDKVDLRVLQALRLGAYQLLFTRVPAHAAVAGTVEVARVALTDGPARFVNAVLRRVSERDLDTWLPEVTPDRALDPIAHLAIKHSHPEWVVRAFADALGEDAARLAEPDSETAQLLVADNERPGVDLAARPGRITPDELAGDILTELGRWTRPGPAAQPVPAAQPASAAEPVPAAQPSAEAQAAAEQQPGPEARPAAEEQPAAETEGVLPGPGGVEALATPAGAAPTAEPAAEVSSLHGQWSPVAVKLPEGAPGDVAAIADGRAHVQDEGSQLCAWTLAVAPLEGTDARWLDLCAGPGGKAGLLASIAVGRGAHLTAVEVAEHRAKLVESAVRDLPATVVVADGRDVGTHPELPEGGFDRVLVDAPCTGLGALRRRPEARWRKQPGDVPALAKLQRELLMAAYRAVRPGGLVAYVTCSPHLAETRVLVADVIRRTGAEPVDVRVVPEAAAAADRNPTPERVSAARAAALQLWPHRHGTDAMFLSLLRKPVGGHD